MAASFAVSPGLIPHALTMPSSSYNLLVDVPPPEGENVDPDFYVASQLPSELKTFIKYPDPSEELHIESYGAIFSRFCGSLTCCFAPYFGRHCFLVKEGDIALTWNNGVPEILGPGRHVINPLHSLDKIVPVSTPLINHGPITVARVKAGQLGYGVDTETGRPVLLSPGRHVINRSTFVFQRFLDLTAEVTELDKLKLVRVETGHEGIVYRRGQLHMLPPGIHLVSPPDRYAGNISKKQQVLELETCVMESSDYVPLAIKADVFYRISDAHKALQNVADIKTSLREISNAQVASIIRSSTLAEIAASSKPSFARTAPTGPSTDLDGFYNSPKAADASATGELPPATAPFYQVVHDRFMQELHDHVLEDWGVAILNIRIESLKINDPRIAEDISKQSTIYAKTQAELANAANQGLIAAAIAEREATSRIVASNAQAQMQRIAVEAESFTITSKARAAAEALAIAAEAEAKAIEIKAGAQAKATELLAQAERKRLELEGEGRASFASAVGQTPLGSQLAVAGVQAQALQGVHKIYVPATPGLLFGLTNGFGDGKEATESTPLLQSTARTA